MEADDNFAFFNKILSKKRTTEALAAEEAIANPEFESAEKKPKLDVGTTATTSTAFAENDPKLNAECTATSSVSGEKRKRRKGDKCAHCKKVKIIRSAKNEGKSKIVAYAKEEDDVKWIYCDRCQAWYHAICVDAQEYEIPLIEKYHCPKCRIEHGNSKMKSKILTHRYHFWNASEKNKPTQIGTEKWIEDFKQRFMLYGEATEKGIIKIYEDGTKLMNDFKRNESWTIPFKVLDKEGLDIRIPDQNFSISDVVKLIGSDHHEDTIDVFAQETYKMSLGRFQALWSEKQRDRLYNMISLEFSGTDLAPLVESPQLVRDLSWEHKFWHQNEVNEENRRKQKKQAQKEYDQPCVSYFCLMGMAGSYTNWHLDLGGSSVWYHVFKGSKVFFIAPPSAQNLEALLRWQKEARQSEISFEDMLPHGEQFRLHLNEGQTLVYEMEALARIEQRFRFPCFEICNFLAAENLMKEKNLDDQVLKEAAAALVEKCTNWISNAPYSFSRFENMVRALDKRIKQF